MQAKGMREVAPHDRRSPRDVAWLVLVGTLMLSGSSDAAVSRSETKELHSGQMTQGGTSTISPTSGRRGRSSIGEAVSGVSVSSARFTVQAGFVAATTPSRPQTSVGQLDLTVLSAKTAPLGTEIAPRVWQRDVDPIFVWEAPAPGLEVAGYSYALDAAPDETIDTPGTSWDVAQDPLQRLTDGVHTFSVKAFNTAGQSGKAVSFELWVDTAPPTVQTYTPQPGLLLNTLVPLISAQVSDPHSGLAPSGVLLQVNGAPVSASVDQTTGMVSVAGSGAVREGSNHIELRLTDQAGNSQTPLVWSFTVDVTPPSGALLVNGGASMTTSVYVTLNLTASDALSGIARMLLSSDPLIGYVDESYASVRELWRLKPVRGTQKVYVKFVDGAGNISGSVSDDIELDLLTPDTAILSGPAGLTPQRTAAFTFSASGEDCLFASAFDDQAWSAWSDQTTAGAPAELAFGNHYFKVKAAKEVNGIPGIQPDEEDPTPAERTWIVGVEAPALFIPRGGPIKLWRVE